MFEPHRLQNDLLRQAYAYLIPNSRRRLSSEKLSPEIHRSQSSENVERKMA